MRSEYPTQGDFSRNKADRRYDRPGHDRGDEFAQASQYTGNADDCFKRAADKHSTPHCGEPVGGRDAAHRGQNGRGRSLYNRQAVSNGRLEQSAYAHGKKTGADHNREYRFR